MIAALLLQCAAAFALEIERFPSYERIVSIEVRGAEALVSTTGGAYRVGFGPGWPSAATDEAGAAAPEPPPLAEQGYPVTARAQYRDGRYAGTFGGGLLLFGRRVEGIPDAVTALAPCPRALLVGTERGLYAVAGARVERIGLRGLPDPDVSALAVADGALWIGHFDGGVSSYSGGVWRHWGEAEGLPSEWIDDLAVDGPRVWLATERGVFWIEDGKVRVPGDPRLAKPTAAVFVGNGRVYAAQPDRIVIWKDGAVAILHVPEAHPQRVWASGGAVWVAGLNGLYRAAAGRVERYDALSSALPGNWITALAPYGGGLMVGTYDAGLTTFGARPSRSLPGAWVNVGALAVSGDRAAAGGREEGLHLLDRGVWRRVRARDGLPGDDVSAVAFDGDRLWVGTRSGLARVSF